MGTAATQYFFSSCARLSSSTCLIRFSGNAHMVELKQSPWIPVCLQRFSRSHPLFSHFTPSPIFCASDQRFAYFRQLMALGTPAVISDSTSFETAKSYECTFLFCLLVHPSHLSPPPSCSEKRLKYALRARRAMSPLTTLLRFPRVCSPNHQLLTRPLASLETERRRLDLVMTRSIILFGPQGEWRFMG